MELKCNGRQRKGQLAVDSKGTKWVWRSRHGNRVIAYSEKGGMLLAHECDIKMVDPGDFEEPCWDRITSKLTPKEVAAWIDAESNGGLRSKYDGVTLNEFDGLLSYLKLRHGWTFTIDKPGSWRLTVEDKETHEELSRVMLAGLEDMAFILSRPMRTWKRMISVLPVKSDHSRPTACWLMADSREAFCGMRLSDLGRQIYWLQLRRGWSIILDKPSVWCVEIRDRMTGEMLHQTGATSLETVAWVLSQDPEGWI